MRLSISLLALSLLLSQTMAHATVEKLLIQNMKLVTDSDVDSKDIIADPSTQTLPTLQTDHSAQQGQNDLTQTIEGNIQLYLDDAIPYSILLKKIRSSKFGQQNNYAKANYNGTTPSNNYSKNSNNTYNYNSTIYNNGQNYQVNNQSYPYNNTSSNNYTNSSYVYDKNQTTNHTRKIKQNNYVYFNLTRQNQSYPQNNKTYNKNQSYPYNNQTYNNQTYNNQTYNNQTYNNNQSYPYNNQTYNNQTYNNQTYNNQTYNNKTHNNQTYTTSDNSTIQIIHYNNQTYAIRNNNSYPVYNLTNLTIIIPQIAKESQRYNYYNKSSGVNETFMIYNSTNQTYSSYENGTYICINDTLIVLSRFTNSQGQNLTEFTFNGTFVDYVINNSTSNMSQYGDFKKTQVTVIKEQTDYQNTTDGSFTKKDGYIEKYTDNYEYDNYKGNTQIKQQQNEQVNGTYYNNHQNNKYFEKVSDNENSYSDQQSLGNATQYSQYKNNEHTEQSHSSYNESGSSNTQDSFMDYSQYSELNGNSNLTNGTSQLNHYNSSSAYISNSSSSNNSNYGSNSSYFDRNTTSVGKGSGSNVLIQSNGTTTNSYENAGFYRQQVQELNYSDPNLNYSTSQYQQTNGEGYGNQMSQKHNNITNSTGYKQNYVYQQNMISENSSFDNQTYGYKNNSNANLYNNTNKVTIQVRNQSISNVSSTGSIEGGYQSLQSENGALNNQTGNTNIQTESNEIVRTRLAKSMFTVLKNKQSGGWQEMNIQELLITNTEIISEAISEVNDKFSPREEGYEFDEVVSVHQQIVAGFNYNIKLRYANEKGEIQLYQVFIYSAPWTRQPDQVVSCEMLTQ